MSLVRSLASPRTPGPRLAGKKLPEDANAGPIQLAQAGAPPSDAGRALQPVAEELWEQVDFTALPSALPAGAIPAPPAGLQTTPSPLPVTASAPAGVSGTTVASAGLHWGWYAAGGLGAAAAAGGGGGGGGSSGGETNSTPNTSSRPSVTISDNVTGTSNAPVTFTFTFSEDVQGFASSDVQVTNGTASNFQQISARQYTLLVTPNPDSSGALTVKVNADVATASGNNQANQAGETSQSFDTLAPTVGITDNVVADTARDMVTFRFSFSEPVSDFAVDNITLSAGRKQNFTRIDDATYTVEVVPPANATGTLAISLPAGAARDAAGNASGAAGPAEQKFNTVPDDPDPPQLTIADNVTGNASGAVTFTFSFNEVVTGFTADDVVLTAGDKGTLQGSGASYTMTVTPPANATGTLSLSVAAGAAQDAAGNGNLAASASQTFDTVPANTEAPVLTISDSASDATNGPFTVYFDFSTAISGFTDSDITITNGSKGALTPTSATQFSLLVTPTANTAGTVSIEVPANAASANGVGNPAASGSQLFDTAAPTLTLGDDEPGLIANGPVSFTISPSEPVGGLTIDKIQVGGGTKGTLTTSGQNYVLLVTPDANSGGTITVDIAANAVTDAAGNGNIAASASQAFNTIPRDNTPPTLSDASPADEATDIGIGSDLVLTFSEDIQVGSGTIELKKADGSAVENFDVTSSNRITINGNTLTINPSSDLLAGTAYKLEIPSGALKDKGAPSNNPYAGLNDYNFTTANAVDAIPPTLDITSSADTVPLGGTATLTFSFSEPIQGFDSGDITIGASGGKTTSTAGTLGTLTPLGDRAYTAVYTAPNTNNGTNSNQINVAAGHYADLAGNLGGGATRSLALVDATTPTVSITDNVPGITNGNVTFSFAFSESVTGFAAGDVTVNNGSKGSFNGSGASYTLVVTPNPNSTGDITVTVPANMANDAAGNGNSASVVASQSFDTQRPTLSITDNVPGTATGDVTFSFNFSEAVTGFDASDVTVAGGTKGTFGGGGSSYTLEVTPTSSATGTIIVNVANGVAQDAAGNTNTAAPVATQAFSYVPGQPVIDLGSYGKLIAPVKVDGENWYYYWDRSGDGTNANVGSFNGGVDYTTHDVLDGLFTQDATGNVGGGGNTNETYRYATLNGVDVALPTAGDGTATNGPRPGTLIDNTPAGEINVTYDDLLAIWDGYNGTDTGTGSTGAPPGWILATYWSATPSASGHASIRNVTGNLFDYSDNIDHNVALLVY